MLTALPRGWSRGSVCLRLGPGTQSKTLPQSAGEGRTMRPPLPRLPPHIHTYKHTSKLAFTALKCFNLLWQTTSFHVFPSYFTLHFMFVDQKGGVGTVCHFVWDVGAISWRGQTFPPIVFCKSPKNNWICLEQQIELTQQDEGKQPVWVKTL